MPPSSASPDATLMQHGDSGTFTVHLTLPISSNSTIPTTTSTGDVEHKRSTMIVDYGILYIVGIPGLLPLGVLIALRTPTFTTQWFAGTRSSSLYQAAWRVSRWGLMRLTRAWACIWMVRASLWNSL
ncbi:hypothetical protein FIBSPDRAFT_288274 [Athelia psychrophila]|uniref:Uncharacterized protein n=1 Tax=Athelia psychrophila TaxID=1759441 RepID=A0A167XMS2_9AGAM|nr:hypothetical protein FIBSPDRAFT_288274 [Fibularhizoctonia sp. CBS 109695]